MTVWGSDVCVGKQASYGVCVGMQASYYTVLL